MILICLSIPAWNCATSQIPTASTAAHPSAEEPSPDVTAAEGLIAKSDWKGAEAKLATWLVNNPNDARALFDAGYVADAQNHFDEAAGFYRRAIEAKPTLFEAHLSLGLLLARQGKLDDARPELEVATTLDPAQDGPAMKARAWRALARIDRTANPAGASSDLLEALKISPETEPDTLMAAELAEAAGQKDTAESAYRRVLAEDPKSAEANAGLAHVLIAGKHYADAESLLRTALQATPDDPTLIAQLATVLVAEDKAEALPLLEKLHRDHAADMAITRMLAEVRAEAGDLAGSDTLYKTLIAAEPKNADLWVAHGQNLIRLKQNTEALQAFTNATELDPANGDGWSGLAFAASKAGQPSITLHALSMRSRYLPELPSTYFLWATSYDSLHDRAAAVTYYHHFLEAAAGKYPNQEWQARQRLLVLEKKN